MNITTIKSKLSNWQAQRRQRQEEKKRKRIEAISHQLYLNRRVQQEERSADTDWKTAERIVDNPLRRIGFQAMRSLYLMKKWSAVIEAIGVVTIPVVLAIAAHTHQVKLEQHEENRVQQQALKDYLNQLSTLLIDLKEDDLRSSENEQLRTLLTAKTLTLLRDPNFHGGRKGQVIEYLAQMKLIQGNSVGGEEYVEPIVSLIFSDLSGANLDRANLSDVDLRGSDLSGAMLRWADLSGADLGYTIKSGSTQVPKASGTIRSYAFLQQTDLSNAYLNGSFLLNANLRGANLSGADLSGADLSEANLSGADLSEADLSGAILNGANVFEMNLKGADLRDADTQSILGDKARFTDVEVHDALLCQTQLPESIDLDPNRDCDRLEISIN